MSAARYKVGDRVRYAYNTAAVSCQSSRRIEGEGVVKRLHDFDHEPPVEVYRFPDDQRFTVFLFDREIIEVLP